MNLKTDNSSKQNLFECVLQIVWMDITDCLNGYYGLFKCVLRTVWMGITDSLNGYYRLFE